MNTIKNKALISILNLIIYVLIITLFSLDNFVTDVIFSIGLITIVVSTLLFLLKVNLDKFKIFIWMNLFLFLLLYSYFFYVECITSFRNNFSTIIYHLIFFQ